MIRTHLRKRLYQFYTASGVFSKERIDLGTRLLIESMTLPNRGCVLDIGCGYGAVGIAAADLNSDLQIIMVDVNRRAVWLSRRNIELNNVSNAEVRCGRLFEPVGGLFFDCVLSNPPVSAGMNIVNEMICGAPRYMTPNSTFQIVLRSKIASKRLLATIQETFGNVTVSARRSGYRVLTAEKT